MPVKKIKQLLDEHKVKYVVLSHSPAYTAQEVAALTHIPGKELAKTVMIKIDNTLAMLVLPASYRVNFEMLKENTGAKKVELASEEEFKYSFPDCEIGAMPPFGNLYGMQVLVAESLTDDEDIAFNAGSHRELVKMKYRDFEKLINPKIVKSSVQFA
ncbi:MAG: aminoacyl-tRNA deacylase [Calditrichaceae bacterium]